MTGRQVIAGLVYGVLTLWLVGGAAIYYSRFTRRLIAEHGHEAERLWQTLTGLF